MYKGERFNAISHLVGAVAALAGMSILIVEASRLGDPWKVVSFSIYGFTLFVLFLFSTLYHSLRGKAKEIFKVFDHVAIYLLIAGTYTPFTLVVLQGAWGWFLFGTVWGLAVIGMLLDSLPQKGLRVLPMTIYLIMGWVCVVALNPLLEELSESGFRWLLMGGIFYTAGIIFYALDKKIRHFHGVWHLFVLAGSICHYFTVLFYVA